MAHVAAVLYLCLLASVVAFNPPKQPIAMPCKFAAKGASYDLTKLQELTLENPITVKDRLQTSQQDYLYTFAICTTTAPPTNCKEADGGSRVTPYWAPAWQTNASQTMFNTPDIEKRLCRYLGGNGDNDHEGNGDLARDAEFSLLDEENPGAGVRLTYKQGQTCHSGVKSGYRRQLHLNFKCSSSQIRKIDQNVMDESAHCEYEITIESEYACPSECGFGGGHSICNNHGVCGYDTDSAVARCFCNEGYSGHGCDTTQETEEDLQGYGPILGLLIFVTISLVVLVAAVVGLWLFMSKRTVPLDGQTYARLENEGSFTPMRMDVKGPDGL